MFWGRLSRGTGIIAALALTIGIAGSTSAARADTFTWTNAGTSWSTAADWADINGTGTLPGSLDVAQFTLPSYTTTATLGAASSLGGLWDTGAGTLRISSSTLTLNGATINGGTANTGIELDPTAGNLLITSSLSLGASQWWINNANTATTTLSVSSALILNGKGLTFSGSGNTVISGIISGSGALAGSITIDGPGQVTLTDRAGSTYSGGTVVYGGTLIVSATTAGNTGALGIGPVTVNPGGTILMSGTGSTYQNEFFGKSPVSTNVLRINSGGLVDDPNGESNIIGTMILDGGTLSALKAINGGNWTLTGSVSTAGGGQTSYMVGGSMTLNQSGSNIFNILGGDKLVISSSMGGNATVKVGSGVLVIAGSDADGQTLGITAGTVQICTGQPGGDGAIKSNITNNATLVFEPNVSTVYAGQITGSGSVLMMGSGTLGLTGASQDPGSTNILSGWVNVGRNANINNGSLVFSTLGLGPILLNGGTLAINGFTTQQPGISGSGGMLVAGSAASLLTLTPTAAMNFFGSLSGPVSVTLNSTTAVQTFSGPNYNTGQITVSAGTLALAGNGTLGVGNNVANPGAILDTTSFGSAGYNLSQGVLVAGRTGSFATDINGSLNLQPGGTIGFSASSVTTTLSNGNMSLGGGSISYNPYDTIALSGTLNLPTLSSIVPTGSLQNGDYTLITASQLAYASTASLDSLLQVVGFFGQSARTTFSFDDSTSTAVIMTVSGGPGNLIWTGSGSNNWFSGTTSLSDTSQNFINTNLGPTSPDYFYAADNVTFNDSGSTGNVVISSSGVSPGSMLVSNSALNYTFSGGPILGSGFMVKSGPGTLTLLSSNGYSGGTTLSAGLLNLGNSGALGSGTLTITGGSLDNTTGAAMTLAGNISQVYSGAFTFVGSNPLNTGAGSAKLSAASDFYISASSLTIAGAVSGGGRLTKDGPGTLVLGASNAYGSTILNAGVLVFVNHGLGTGGVTLNGGTLQYATGNSYDLSGNGLNLAGVGTVDTNGNNVTWLSGEPVSGTGSLVKIGSGNLTLSNTEAYTGSTTVNNGSLTLSGYQYGAGNGYSTVWGTMAGGSLNINSGGLVNLSNQYVLGVQTNQIIPAININGGTLSSNSAIGWGTNISMTAGTINGSLVLGAGATINVTGTNASSLIGALSVGDSTNLTFNVSRGSGPADLIIASGIGSGDPFGALDADPIGGSSPNWVWRSQPSLGWETGGVVWNGNGIVVLGGSSSYYGNTTINGGTLQVGMGGAAAALPVYEQLTLGNADGSTDFGPSGSSSITNNGTLAFSSTDSLIQGIHFSALPISGSGSLVQLGPGNLTLNVANTYTGGTILSGGSLTIANTAAIGTGLLTVNGGVFNLNGLAFTPPGLNGSGGTVTSVAPATLLFGSAAPATYSGSITGAVAVTVNSNATVQTLAGSNTYTGQTSISTGTLALAPGGTLGNGLTVITPGGVLDTSAYGSGGFNFAQGTLIASRNATFGIDINGTLNVQGAIISPAGANTAGTVGVNGGFGLNGGTLAYDPGDQIAASGALNLPGTGYIVPNNPLPPGVYTLFTAGSLPGSLSNLEVAGLFGNSARQTYTFAASGGTAVTLAVTGIVGNLTWTGGTNGTWDNQTSASWYNSVTSAADVFYQGDLVTFNDTAGTANNVTINDAVQPAALVISNTAVNFTFSGSGSIVGSVPLVKNGPGSLTINNSNTFTGGTALNGGMITANAASAFGSGIVARNGAVLNIGNSAALGSAPLTISGGTLDNSSGAAMTLSTTNTQTWNGNVTFLGSNPLNLGADSVVLGANTLLTVANGNLTVPGTISGSNGFALNGSGTLALAGSNTYTGGTGLISGELSFTGGALGSGSIAMGGGTLQFASGNTQDISSQLLLPSGIATIDTNGNNLIFAKSFGGGGSGSLDKVGSGSLVLAAANTFTGNTTVNGGTLQLNVQGNGSSPGALMSPTVTVNPGTTLALNVTDALAYIPGVAALTINDGTVSNTTSGSRVTIENPVTMIGGLLTGSGTGDANGVYSLNMSGSVNAFNATSDSSGNSAVVNVRAIGMSESNTSLVFNVTRGPASPAADFIFNAALNEYSGDSGNGINLTGNGIMLLTASNNYNGPTTISGGTLELGSGLAGQDGSINKTSGVNNMSVMVYNLAGSQAATYAVRGNGSLTKTGSGFLALSGSSSYTGGTSITGGALQLGSASALGGGGAGPLAINGAMLDLNGFGATAAGLNGSGGTVSSAAPAVLTLTPASAANYFGTISGAVAMTLNAPGATQTLSGANTYIGSTTIVAGTLALGASGTMGTGGLVMDPGSMLDVSAYGSGGYTVTNGTLAAGRTSAFATDISGTLNIQDFILSPAGSGAAGTLNVDGGLGLGSGTLAYDVGDKVATQGALSFSGTTTLVPSTALPSGNYTLFTAASMSGGASNFAMTGFYAASPRQTFTFNTSSGTAVTLTVTGSIGNLTWTGGSNNTWDNQISTSWFNSNTSSADKFYLGDNVTFDDSAGSAAGNVTISGSVQPATLNFNNSAVSYSFSGGPIIGITSLVKNGSGALTLNNSNTYTGGTMLNGGVINANAAAAFGSGSVSVAGSVLNANAAQALPNAAVSINGGTLAINAAQSPTSLSIVSSQLNLNNPSAIGNSPLAITNGTLDNTSGTSVSLTGSSAQVWNGNLTFLGSNPLNTGTGTVSLGSSVQLNVNSSNFTVGGAMSGSSGLTLNGPGTLTLAASNTYSGGTVLDSGVLAFATGGLGSGTTTLNGGTLQYASGNTQDISSKVLMPSGTATIDTHGNNVTFASSFGGGGSGSLVKIGAGSLVLNAANSFTGNSTVSGGTLQLNVQGNGGSPGALMSPTVTVNPGATLALNVVDALAYIPGVAALTIDGGTVSNITSASRVTLENTVTMVGGLLTGLGAGDGNGNYSFNMPGTVDAFNVTSDSSGNPAVVNVQAIGISQNNTSLVFNVTRGPAAPAADFIFNAALNNYGGYSGNGFDLTGNGIMLLSGNNTYNGPTTIGGGTLQLGTGQSGQDGSIANSSGVLDSTAMIYDLAGSQTAAYPISGSGSLTLSSGSIGLGGVNSYTGGTFIAGGLLQVANSSALGNGALAANGGTLDLQGLSVTVTSFSGAAGVVTNSVSATVATFTVNQPSAVNAAGSTTFSGSINDGAGQVALVKTATGTLTLSSSSNYSGGTTLTDGSIVVTNPASLGAQSGALSIDAATLEVAAGFADARNITVTNANATIQVDAGQTYFNSGTISGSGGLYKTGSGTLEVSGSANLAHAAYVPAGLLQIDGDWTSPSLNINGGTSGSAGSGQLAGTGTITVEGDGMYYNSTLASDFAGTIVSTGGGGLEVDGGTLTLSGTNTFDGGTAVVGGELILTNSEALADGSSLFVGDASAFTGVVPAAGSDSIADPIGAGIAASSNAAIAAVPEPGTLLILSLGAAIVAVYRTRRRQ